MNWLSFFIGLLCGWLIEWIIDFFYWRRRGAGHPSDAAQLRTELAESRANADRLAATLRESAAAERLATENAAALRSQVDEGAAAAAGQTAELASLRNRLAVQEELERRLHECEGRVDWQRAEMEKLQANLAPAANAAEPAAGVTAASAAFAAQPPAAAPAGERFAGLAGEVEPAAVSEATAEEAAAATRGAAPVAPDAPQDDLEIIEGIGPKIAALLRQHGITTFAGLATAATPQLQAILRAAGPRYQMANPGSWPGQAALAAAGKWDELKALQDRLNAGLEEQRP